MYKVICWGPASQWDVYHNFFEREILKGNMMVCGIICNEEGMFCSIDGIPVLAIEQILSMEFDYLIDMHQNMQDMVSRILELLKIPGSKRIPARVFGQPFFDLNRWVSVSRSRVSILANNCWGGYTYHSLGLEFHTPFINMSIPTESFLRMLKDFSAYMEETPEFAGEAWEPNLKRNYPVFRLRDVELHLNHYTDYQEALEIWNARKQRLNYENLFAVVIIEKKEDLETFLEIPFRYKVAFSTVPCDDPNVMYFPAIMENGYVEGKYNGNVWNFVNHMAMENSDECRQYDILKLLNHEEDYRRAQMRIV